MKGSEYQKREKKKENIYHTMIRRLKEAQPHLYTSPQTLLLPPPSMSPLMPVVTKGEKVNLELIAPLLKKQKC